MLHFELFFTAYVKNIPCYEFTFYTTSRQHSAYEINREVQTLNFRKPHLNRSLKIIHAERRRPGFNSQQW